jgi:hypothetical protein
LDNTITRREMMKKTISVILFTIALTGCGVFEKAYDKSNYESLSNESGEISLYSGGVLIARYENATIRYASADSEAVWLTDAKGNNIYWQGHMMLSH